MIHEPVRIRQSHAMYQFANMSAANARSVRYIVLFNFPNSLHWSCKADTARVSVLMSPRSAQLIFNIAGIDKSQSGMKKFTDQTINDWIKMFLCHFGKVLDCKNSFFFHDSRSEGNNIFGITSGGDG